MLCLDCRHVVSVAVRHPLPDDDPYHYDESSQEPPPLNKCPNCSGTQLEEVLLPEGRTWPETVAAVPCPKCGEVLTIESKGIVD